MKGESSKKRTRSLSHSLALTLAPPPTCLLSHSLAYTLSRPHTSFFLQHQWAALVRRIMQCGASRARFLVVNVGALAKQQIRAIKAIKVDGMHKRRTSQGI